MRLSARIAAVCAAGLIVLFAAPAVFAAEPGNSYQRRDLVSDGGVPAEHVDADLING